MIFCTIKEKEFVNPGFLYGPFVPIYGFGATAIYLCSLYFHNLFFPLLLIIYFLVPTLIEYFTSYVFEKIFHIKFWDYSEYKFNINGRVNLLFSLAWFGFVLLAVFFIQPFVLGVLENSPKEVLLILSEILIIYFIIDLSFSIRIYYYFSKIKNKLMRFIESRPKMDVEKFLKDNPILLRIKDVLRPMNSFPNIKKSIQNKNAELIERLRNLKRIKKRILHEKL